MKSGLCRTLIVLFSTLVFGSFFLCVQGLQAQDSDTDLESTTQLIVMIDGVEFGLKFGAGIIFGWDKERIYIATANHVVRRGSQEAQSPQIRLKALPDKPFKATLLQHADQELDLAVLSLEWPDNEKVDPCALRIDRLGRTAIKRGDPVYAVGNPNGVPWGMPVAPDRVAQIVGVQVTFQSAYISNGHSGGGLLSRQGEVVGMIRADQPPFGSATNIESILQALGAWGYPVKLRVANSPSPLYIASEKGSVNEVKRLLEDKCPEVDVRYDGMTPLLIAADKGWGPIVDLLLKAGAQKNIRIENKEPKPDTPLHLAVENGHVDVAKLLIDAGADLEANSPQALIGDDPCKPQKFRGNPCTPLVLAVAYGHREVARLLIKAGAKTDFVKKGLEPNLHWTARTGHVEAVKLLIEIGADIEQVDSSGQTPLFTAVTNGQTEVVKLFLGAGANVNASGIRSWTPLGRAIVTNPRVKDSERANNIEIIKLLVRAAANIEQRLTVPPYDYVETPLILAIKWRSYGQVEVVKILLEAGANVNGADDNGRTALHYAAEYAGDGSGAHNTLAIRLALLQLLLQAGANVNAKDKYGDPPICRALSMRISTANLTIKTAEILVKAGSVRIWPQECKHDGRLWYQEKLDPLMELYGVK
jgi:ankyrin repeat protein